MTRAIVSRCAWSLLTLFLFLTMMFFLLEALMPWDFTVQYSLELTRDEREALRAELGIDRPLGERYVEWISNLLRGDLGDSLYGYPVSEVLRETLPPSLFVFLTGTGLAFVIGIVLAKWTAWDLPSWLGTTITFGAISINTMFPPWVAFLLTYFFAKEIIFSRLLFRPVFGNVAFEPLDPAIWDGFSHSPIAVCTWITLSWLAGVAAVLVLSGILRRKTRRPLPLLLSAGISLAFGVVLWKPLGFQSQALDVLHRAVLPITAFSLLSFGEFMLILRTAMTDIRKQEHVRAARAKGLRSTAIRDRHVVRIAILPAISRLVITLPSMLTSAVIVEDVFNWPGLGSTLANAVCQQDLAVANGALLIIGMFAILARLLIDVFNAFLDPRLRPQMPV